MKHQEDENAILWPDVPRFCFGAGPDRGFDAELGWLQRRGTDFHAYAEGYRRSAEALFDHVQSSRLNPSYAVYPLSFLWRHHIELTLKWIVCVGKELDDEEPSFPAGHEVVRLWQQARRYIARCGDPAAPELANVEANLIEIQRIDPRADGFRYPVGRDGTTVTLADAPEVVNLRTLQTAMLAVSTFLESVRYQLQLMLERQLEWLAHVGDY